MDCIIFTAKRTIRERWRQIVTEGTRGLGFFLATIDTSISDKQLAEMKAHRIYLVVPRDIRMSGKYQEAENVLDFETFFLDHLDPAMARWRRKIKKT
ncbi:MAG: type II restriction endonuclease [Sedimentisphaerales bacterium]|nr:type II restriction endonuclease [Sedimentisphaerales bacterium]